MSASYYSFWLVPQEPDLTYFQGVINTLAKRFGTIPFCPHVTLYSGPAPALTQLPSVAPIELVIDTIQWESRFSKTLYVQLVSSPPLGQLVNQLVAAIPHAQPPALDPHLSLLYHHLEPAAQKAMAETISLPRATVRFDQVQTVAAPSTFETQAHVASLRCTHRQLLTAP
ncbi:MAG: hypothetical protein AAGI69_23945 [Cyanobacteria bacterium P01_H01_bin.21]